MRHLQALEDAGQLELCGPFDGGGGMVVLRVDTLEQAEAIAQADPFVARGVRSYRLRAWRLSCAENDHMGFA